MLKEFIRNYAVSMGFAKDDADYIADSREDQELYTLSLNDLNLCTIAPANDNGKNCALAIVALGEAGEDDAFHEQVSKLMSDLKRCTRHKCTLIPTVSNNVLGFFAVIALDGCTQSSFNDFMSSLTYFVMARVKNDYQPEYAEFNEDEKEISEFLSSAGLSPEALNESFDSIAFPDGPVVRIIKRAAQRDLLLQSLVGAEVSGKLIRQLLEANIQMLGHHYFVCDSIGSVYFNSPVSINDGSEVFYDALGVHVGLCKELASYIARGEREAEFENTVQPFSDMLMV